MTDAWFSVHVTLKICFKVFGCHLHFNKNNWKSFMTIFSSKHLDLLFYQRKKREFQRAAVFQIFFLYGPNGNMDTIVFYIQVTSQIFF